MKKIIWTIAIILIIIIIVIAVKINSNTRKISDISSFNKQFEDIYKDKTLYGADVLTIINKAIDNNTLYHIEKDDSENYIDDGKYCLRVEITLLGTNDEGEIYEVQRQMEALKKAGLEEFIASFSLTSFKCINVEYNR